MKPQPLTAAEIDEIEELAKSNAAETYRGALLALVGEVRRLRAARPLLASEGPSVRARN